MAQKKKAYSKKNSAVKKKKTTKSSNTTKNTAKKSTSAKRKVTNTKKKTTTVKKTTTAKKAATASKTAVAKKTQVKKPNIKPIREEDFTVELPKLKGQAKKSPKIESEEQRVIKTEDFPVIKKEPIRLDKEAKLPKEQPTSKKHKKSKAKVINKTKKSSFKKSFNKLKRKIKIYGITSVIPAKYIALIIVIVALLVSSPFIYKLLTNKAVPINIEAIPDKIDHLEIVSFNINDVDNIVEASSNEYSKLVSYYEYHFENMFHLPPSYVDEYSLKYNDSNKQVLFVIKASDGNQDNVKNIFDSFLKENNVKNYDYLEYQGYQIYINAGSEENNTKVKSRIMQSKKEIFSYLKKLSKDEIDQTFKIAPSLYKEELVKTAMVIKSDTCQYVIFKPTDDESKEEIKQRMNDYYESLEIKWSNNINNKNLVKNRLFEEYQGYLIYIVSFDNKLVMDLIKSNK